MEEDPFTTDRIVAAPWLGEPLAQGDEALALVVVWFHEEPERVGQVVPIEAGGSWLGRAREMAHGRPPAAPLIEQRPGHNRVMAPLETPWISRHHLYLKPRGDDAVEVVNYGKCELLHNGERVGRGCEARAGDTLLIENLVMFLVESRPRTLEPLHYLPAPGYPFGAADAYGMVGESPAIWTLRDHVAAVAGFNKHVLVRGPPGSGKALVAEALHSLSTRCDGPCEVCNTATIPPGLLDSELFGTARDYPECGLRARDGLIGALHGGTLILDEIGEMPAAQQAHLLSVLDAGGRYHRLGETEARCSNVRLVAATNRAVTELKQDFVARFFGRISVTGLADRRSDIPLLVRCYLGIRTGELSNQVARFLRGGDPARPLIDPALIDALVRHHYTENTRELFRVLGTAMESSPGEFIGYTAQAREELGAAGEAAPDAGPGDTLPAATLPSAETLAAATAVLLAGDSSVSSAASAARSAAAAASAPAARSAAPVVSAVALPAPPVVAPGDPTRHNSTLPPLRPSERVTREQAIAVLEAEHGNITQAAARVGLTRESFKRRLVRLGLRAPKG